MDLKYTIFHMWSHWNHSSWRIWASYFDLLACRYYPFLRNSKKRENYFEIVHDKLLPIYHTLSIFCKSRGLVIFGMKGGSAFNFSNSTQSTDEKKGCSRISRLPLGPHPRRNVLCFSKKSFQIRKRLVKNWIFYISSQETT